MPNVECRQAENWNCAFGLLWNWYANNVSAANGSMHKSIICVLRHRTNGNGEAQLMWWQAASSWRIRHPPALRHLFRREISEFDGNDANRMEWMGRTGTWWRPHVEQCGNDSLLVKCMHAAVIDPDGFPHATQTNDSQKCGDFHESNNNKRIGILPPYKVPSRTQRHETTAK